MTIAIYGEKMRDLFPSYVSTSSQLWSMGFQYHVVCGGLLHYKEAHGIMRKNVTYKITQKMVERAEKVCTCKAVLKPDPVTSVLSGGNGPQVQQPVVRRLLKGIQNKSKKWQKMVHRTTIQPTSVMYELLCENVGFFIFFLLEGFTVIIVQNYHKR